METCRRKSGLGDYAKRLYIKEEVMDKIDKALEEYKANQRIIKHYEYTNKQLVQYLLTQFEPEFDDSIFDKSGKFGILELGDGFDPALYITED